MERFGCGGAKRGEETYSLANGQRATRWAPRPLTRPQAYGNMGHGYQVLKGERFENKGRARTLFQLEAGRLNDNRKTSFGCRQADCRGTANRAGLRDRIALPGLNIPGNWPRPDSGSGYYFFGQNLLFIFARGGAATC